MANLYAIKVFTGYCGCDNYDYIICEAGQEEEYAEQEAISNGESFYEEDDGDYDEYMADCGYYVELVQKEFTGSIQDASAKFGCPSQYL